MKIYLHQDAIDNISRSVDFGLGSQVTIFTNPNQLPIGKEMVEMKLEEIRPVMAVVSLQTRLPKKFPPDNDPTYDKE